MSEIVTQVGAWIFATLVGALVVGRMGLLVLQLLGRRSLAATWATKFDQYTAYLR